MQSISIKSDPKYEVIGGTSTNNANQNKTRILLLVLLIGVLGAIVTFTPLTSGGGGNENNDKSDLNNHHAITVVKNNEQYEDNNKTESSSRRSPNQEENNNEEQQDTTSSSISTTSNSFSSFQFLTKKQKLLLGIFSAPFAEKIERRAVLRRVYNFQKKTMKGGGQEVDVRFILGGASVNSLLLEEQNRHHDLIFLPGINETVMRESLFTGKIMAYYNFSQQQQQQQRDEYAFVAKGDDDAFFHLPNLVKYINSCAARVVKQKKDGGQHYFYIGRQRHIFPGSTDTDIYFAGFLYILSSNLVAKTLVEHVKNPILRRMGDEIQVYEYIKRAMITELETTGKPLNVEMFNNTYDWFNHPDSKTYWLHPLHSQAVAIHKCKNSARIEAVMKYYFKDFIVKVHKL